MEYSCDTKVQSAEPGCVHRLGANGAEWLPPQGPAGGAAGREDQVQEGAQRGSHFTTRPSPFISLGRGSPIT